MDDDMMREGAPLGLALVVCTMHHVLTTPPFSSHSMKDEIDHAMPPQRRAHGKRNESTFLLLHFSHRVLKFMSDPKRQRHERETAL